MEEEEGEEVKDKSGGERRREVKQEERVRGERRERCKLVGGI